MIVVLAEKPSVARDLARILGAKKRHDGYLEGGGYQVTWAFGHLLTLEEPEAYDPSLKNWNFESLPFVPEKYKITTTKSKGAAQQFRLIKKLFQGASSIICATDAGREGELIFRYIYEKCRIKTPFDRLWISSLTDQAIRQGFRQLRNGREFDHLADAARCRSQADWLVGLNATRAYTLQYSHGQGVLSVGRVQSPVLAMIVRRDQEIRNFKPEPFWELISYYRQTPFKYKAGRFEKQNEAQELFQQLQNQPLVIQKIEQKKQSSPAPQLFDLTELQRRMNKKCKFSADQTLKIAQSLYEKKLITYPRTDSRYLTDDLYPTCGKTLEQLRKQRPEAIEPLNLQSLPKSKRYFNDSKVTDHHAIIPTGQFSSSLDSGEKQVYQEIMTRFIAAFYPNCEKALSEVTATILESEFHAKGSQILTPGWLALYGSEKKDKEPALPNFDKGESGPQNLQFKESMTRPPAAYSEATLLSAMETAGRQIDDEELKEAMKDKGLGTPATRAAIIETLVRRNYIIKTKNILQATSKGELIISCLGKNTLSSPEMTGEWESQLKAIEQGQKTATEFMAEAEDLIRKMIQHLGGASEEGAAFLGLCPLCRQEVIKGKTAYGCSAWKQGCQFRLPAEAFGVKLGTKEVSALLGRGRTSHPRKLVNTQGEEVKGYLSLNKQSQLEILTMEEKEAANSLGSCPSCGFAVVEKFKSYSCIGEDCRFVIWKLIAGRKTSEALAKTLLAKGRSRELKGFKSKAGKKFSATLHIKDGKVEFDFPPRREKK